MLGIDVAKSAVEKYRPHMHAPRSPAWQTFLSPAPSRFCGGRFLHSPDGEVTRCLYDEVTSIQLGDIPDRHGWNRLLSIAAASKRAASNR
jgi:hypothetical protein